MSHKKNSGVSVFTLLAGVAAGAAALFFSKKENRDKTVEVVKNAEKKITEVSKEIKKDPKAFANKVVEEVSKKAKSVKKSAAKAKKAAPAKAAAAAKTTVSKAKKVAKAPAKKKASKTSSVK